MLDADFQEPPTADQLPVENGDVPSLLEGEEKVNQNIMQLYRDRRVVRWAFLLALVVPQIL
jgi:hypothetical protein